MYHGFFSPARASNLGPGPRRSGSRSARVAQALDRPASDSLSELPAQVWTDPVFLFVFKFQLLKLFNFVCNGKVIIFCVIFL